MSNIGPVQKISYLSAVAKSILQVWRINSPCFPPKIQVSLGGPGMAVMDISIVDLSHWVPLAPQVLLICTFYPNEIFGGKHGELIRQIKTKTWEHNNRRTEWIWLTREMRIQLNWLLASQFSSVKAIPSVNQIQPSLPCVYKRITLQDFGNVNFAREGSCNLQLIWIQTDSLTPELGARLSQLSLH